MELHLTFKETEIRELYKNSFDVQDNEIKKRLKGSRTTLIVFGSLTLIFLLLTNFHKDWIYYAIACAVFAFGFSFWTWRLSVKHHEKIKREKKDVEEFIKKYREVDGIKYVYDNISIRYFESNQLKVEIDWDDFKRVDKYDEWIYIHFKNVHQNIWIPFVTVDKLELQLLEDFINQRIQSAG